MLTIKKELDIHPDYDFSQIAPLSRIVFFDIETTGLSADRSGLYLIGAVYYEASAWRLVQWFAESMYDEEEMLAGFFGLLSEKRRAAQKEGGRHANAVLIHFNGDTFDIPYLRRVIQRYRLPYEFTGVLSLDLYKKIKPYKALLGLSDCRLKTVEQFFGIAREDRFNGGELIYVYEEYLRLSSLDPESCESNEQNQKLREHLLKTLLLHNEEDMANLPCVCGLLAYDDLFRKQYRFVSASVEELSGKQILDLKFTFPEALPQELDYEEGPYVLSAGRKENVRKKNVRKENVRKENVRKENARKENGDFGTAEKAGDAGQEPACGFLEVTAELYEGELKYFFADYKNYYYLTAEDYAVHKSVGEFVERKARKQATARTCYQKKTGLFLPQPENLFLPVFYREYKGSVGYAEFTEDMLSDGERLRDYAAALLSRMLKHSGKKQGRS